MPNPIVHFEIPADDLPRAKAFYEQALGWKISDPWQMGYYLVETKDGELGINGGLMERKMPGQPFMNYMAAASIDAALEKIERAGGAVVMPKTEIGPGMGWIAVFKDTEGNLVGFHESAPKPPAPKKAAAKKAAAKKAPKKAAPKKKAATKARAGRRGKR